jgi:hypothetical protein
MALADPKRSPLAPLQKGGNGLLVPLVKEDLGGSLGFMSNKNNFSNTLLSPTYPLTYLSLGEYRLN